MKSHRAGRGTDGPAEEEIEPERRGRRRGGRVTLGGTMRGCGQRRNGAGLYQPGNSPIRSLEWFLAAGVVRVWRCFGAACGARAQNRSL